MINEDSMVLYYMHACMHMYTHNYIELTHVQKSINIYVFVCTTTKYVIQPPWYAYTWCASCNVM